MVNQPTQRDLDYYKTLYENAKLLKVTNDFLDVFIPEGPQSGPVNDQVAKATIAAYVKLKEYVLELNQNRLNVEKSFLQELKASQPSP